MGVQLQTPSYLLHGFTTFGFIGLRLLATEEDAKIYGKTSNQVFISAGEGKKE